MAIKPLLFFCFLTPLFAAPFCQSGDAEGDGCSVSAAGTSLSTLSTLGDISSRRHSPDRFQRMDQRKLESDLPQSALWSLLKAEQVNHWRGVPFRKGAQEIAMYPQLIFELNPRTIIEVGTYAGGSALWLADTAKVVLQRDVPVFTLDLDDANLHPSAIAHPEVHSFLCDVTDYTKCSSFLAALGGRVLDRPWLVSEDAHHGLAHQLEWWHQHLLPGDYLVVEDTSPDQNQMVHELRKGEEGIPPVAEKLGIVEQFVAKYPEQYAVDSYFQDMFGYNALKEWNSILKRVA